MAFEVDERLRIFINGERLDAGALQQNGAARLKPDDTGLEIDVRLLSLRGAAEESSWMILWDGEMIACSTRARISSSEDEIARVFELVRTIEPGQSELWPHSHRYAPNSGRTRQRTATPELRQFLEKLELDFQVQPPPADHTRLGAKTVSIRDLTQLHVDRFDGMREGERSIRRRVSRHFVNLSRKDSRTSAFVLMDPALVDEHVPDRYSPDYLSDLYRALEQRVDLLIVKTPPREGAVVNGVKYLATHLLHCEYGDPPDFVAVIQSDSETRRERV